MGWLEKLGEKLRGPDGALAVYMHEVELAQLLDIVLPLRPRRVLEWGSGGSTAMFLSRVPSIELLVSIENDAAWYERVREAIDDPRLQLFLVGPNHPPPSTTGLSPKAARAALSAFHLRCEREPELMHDYVARPKTLGHRFDLVLVDGRARSFCIAAGWDLLEPGGVLLLHDAQRPEYKEAMLRLGSPQWLEPWHQGQLCVARKPA